MIQSNILFVGPPASGKTSFIKEVLKNLPSYSYKSIDDFVDNLCFEKGISTVPIPLSIIHESADQLLKKTMSKEQIIELSFHDYESLISKNILDTHQFHTIVFLEADLENLYARNFKREKSIPKEYILKCYTALPFLKKYLFDNCFSKTIFIKTDKEDFPVSLNRLIIHIIHETN